MAQTKPKAGQFYGVSNNGTDGEFLQTDGTGGMAWASPITNPTITSIDYPGSATAANPAGGESVIINGTLFASGITCTVGGTSAVTAFNSATQITITTPVKAAGPYTVAVLNPDGGTASQASFIQYSGVPVWSTAAGTLGNVIEGTSASFQVTATEGSDTIEYAVTTGTLPTGLSLATATGAITGAAPTVSADTTTTFSITATDDENQTSASRSFSITVQNDAPSNYFNTVLYNGNGGTQSITGLNFSPDLVWIKKRNATEDHAWFDTVRGTQQQLSSNLTSADYTTSNALSSFNSDGFTTGNNGATNNSSGTYVSWNFKAGGAAVANTDGSINSQVSVNNTLGFSIVKYTGSSPNQTVGHGLDATPEFIVVKNMDTAGNGWATQSPFSGGADYHMMLNGTQAAQNNVDWIWNDVNPTSTVFSIGQNGITNTSGDNYISYCFTSKPGFSKVGSYTGNGSTSGPMVQTGFEPAFLMIKSASSSSTAWNMWDNKRTPYDMLRANANDAEYAGPGRIQFFANGFQLLDADASRNSSGGNYIYLAFAADGSTATPSLANSFATEIYTGNSGTQSITTGFKPDFSWIKARNIAYNHALVDSVRGRNSTLISDLTNAANPNSGVDKDLISFDTNGITVGPVNQAYINPSYNMVSWNWKAGGTPSINTDGTITSVVSANQAAGFSIVNWSGNGSNDTIGHGLSAAPEMIFYKSISATQNWTVLTTAIDGSADGLVLNDTSVKFNIGAAGATPTSTVFGNVGFPSNMIAYCFKSISGYSKVGTYTWSGTSYTAGTMVTGLGFTPGLVIIKRTNGTANWQMYDSSRGATSGTQQRYALYPDSASSEDTSGYQGIGFDSDGFSAIVGADGNTTGGGGLNENGGTYIYLAIKEN